MGATQRFRTPPSVPPLSRLSSGGGSGHPRSAVVCTACPCQRGPLRQDAAHSGSARAPALRVRRCVHTAPPTAPPTLLRRHCHRLSPDTTCPSLEPPPTCQAVSLPLVLPPPVFSSLSSQGEWTASLPCSELSEACSPQHSQNKTETIVTDRALTGLIPATFLAPEPWLASRPLDQQPPLRPQGLCTGCSSATNLSDYSLPTDSYFPF